MRTSTIFLLIFTTSFSLKAQLSEPIKELTIHIEDISEDILQYDKLESLSIDFVYNIHSSFDYIPEVVFKLTSLKELYILGEYPYGMIKEIPKSIGQLINLERLSINGHDKIERLPQEITRLKKLSYLSLGQCNINDSNSLGYITKLKQLEELDLSGNEIISLPQTFSQLKNLRKLDLSNLIIEGAPARNMFERFPEVICELENLESLLLHGQIFNEFPKNFRKLNLREYDNYTFLDWFDDVKSWEIVNEKEKLFINLNASKNFRVYKNANNDENIIYSGYWLFGENGTVILFTKSIEKSNGDVLGDLLKQNKGMITLKIKNKKKNESFTLLDLKTGKSILLKAR